MRRVALPDRSPSRRRVLLGAAAATFALVGGACTTDADRPDDVAGPTGSTGSADAGRVPAPAGFVRTSWSTEPHTRGSYSFLAVGSDPAMRAALAAPVVDLVWFAGEATSTEHPATVHGAQRSGAAAAEAIDAAAEGPLQVAVIGAGVAGARAARDLRAAGHGVVVVEAGAGAGGRTRTVRPDGWPVPVELGASWVHDTDATDLADQLDALGVATVSFAYGDVVLTPDGERSTSEDLGPIADAIEASLGWAEEQEEDVSLATALEDSGEADALDPVALDHVLRTEVTTEYGADADELSAWWGLAEGTEGDDRLVTGGYSALAEADLDGIDTRYGWVVGSVAVDDGAVTVTSANQEVLRADRVVVTVPLGVLQADLIAFDPPLPPDKREAIEAIGMGVLDKVWLRWDEPWWTEEAEQWTLVAGPDEPYVEWFNLLPATGEAVLLGLVGGRRARAWAERSDDEVRAAALRTLQSFADAGW